MSRIVNFFLRISDSIYALGVFIPLISISCLIIIGNPNPEFLRFLFRGRAAVILDGFVPHKYACTTEGPGSVSIFSVDNRWEKLKSPFELTVTNWYSAEDRAAIRCDGIAASISFPGQQQVTVFRLMSSRFDLPVFEVSQGTLRISNIKMVDMGTYIDKWGSVYTHNPTQLTISAFSSHSIERNVHVDITHLPGAASRIYILRDQNQSPGNSVSLSLANPQNTLLFFSDRQNPIKPIEAYLTVD